MRTIITDGTDSDTVAGLVERIIETLRELERLGRPVVTAHELWSRLDGPANLRKALRAAQSAERIVIRRIDGNGKRPRYIALTSNADQLPTGGAL